MSRYLNEITRVFQKNGLTVQPGNKYDYAEVLYENKPFCVIFVNGLHHHPKDIDTDEKKALLEKVQNQRESIQEYIAAYEKAPELKPNDPNDGYKLLAEYNSTVLAAMDQKQHGYQFAIWNRENNDSGLTLGSYTHSYESAKQSFAVRSGLISIHKIFSKAQAEDIYSSLNYCRNEDPDLTTKQDDNLKNIMEQIEYEYPGIESVLDTEQSSNMKMEM